MERKLHTGETAPDFTLPSTEGPLTLADFRGEWVVLYFYPKDNTPGCTTQACDLRDNLGSLDARVLGVSPDPLSSHEKFRDDHGLTFPLHSHDAHSPAAAYGPRGEKPSVEKAVS